jgi:hypothetical protein
VLGESSVLRAEAHRRVESVSNSRERTAIAEHEPLDTDSRRVGVLVPWRWLNRCRSSACERRRVAKKSRESKDRRRRFLRPQSSVLRAEAHRRVESVSNSRERTAIAEHRSLACDKGQPLSVCSYRLADQRLERARQHERLRAYTPGASSSKALARASGEEVVALAVLAIVSGCWAVKQAGVRLLATKGSPSPSAPTDSPTSASSARASTSRAPRRARPWRALQAKRW